MTVYAIAIVDSEGDCGTIYIPGATFEDEGTWANDNTKTVVHVTTQMEDYDRFAKQNYYKDGKWLDRNERTGEYYDWKNEAWVLNSDRLWTEIRQERDKRIYVTDWTQLSDSPLSDSKKAEWAAYRTALRDIPSDNSGVTHLSGVIWPDKPS